MLEVIGAGFGRTGTKSLQAAIERLGFGPCHHMLGMFEKPEEIPAWRQAAQGRPVDWDEIYKGYRSSVDFPGAVFWRELVAHFPEAKVVLTVRDPERWYKSAYNTIYSAAVDDTPTPSPVMAQMRTMSQEVVWDGLFEGRFGDADHARKIFDEHIAAVRREVPADRLLVFEVAQGWEPLCAFLGVPVPDEPFPRLNDQEEFGELLAEHGPASV
ncbi:sulfotransferase family protein [Actinomadura darangshiensis]|uniref:Sulfotransferase family protein n=1 Tax=Actinomadura darangshiensis TaxID=705336 RepID=A0A4R5BLR0_9ACTN|nr:sulfotransferase family protein [Actinomadura darangshiensis]TDD87661.1 sulfotransferase family protein [Actinomadura darangshiensis]